MTDTFGYASDNLDSFLDRAGGFLQAADSLTWPAGAGLGQARIVAGADTPPELVAAGRPVALLFYDIQSGVEVGYHFIASGSTGPPAEATLDIGYVTYGTPGDPSTGGVPSFLFVTGNAVSSGLIDVQSDMSIELTLDLWHQKPFNKYSYGEGGTKTFALVGAISATANIPYAGSYLLAPRAFCNIITASGPSARWGCRALNMTTSGFTIFIFVGDAADPPFTGNMDVTWQTFSR